MTDKYNESFDEDAPPTDSTNQLKARKDTVLNPDTPLLDPEKDRLGYVKFSEQMANTLTKRAPSRGFVVGVYGQWGIGKSTILEFMRATIEDSTDSCNIVWFNPWRFSDDDDLTQRFLLELLNSFSNKQKYDQIRNRIAQFGESLSNLPLDALAGGLPAQDTVSAFSSFISTSSESIEMQKREIEEELKNLDERIIVFIDDIDRLTPSEVAQMFKLVKGVADFPNTTYVLALDPVVVSDAIERVQEVENGNEFLEKIIQLNRHVPEPKAGALERIFSEEISEILDIDTLDNDIPEQHRWEALLRNGIYPTIDTPRDVVRYLNLLDISYDSVGNETNVVDLIGWELLREFYTGIYDEVIENRDRFLLRRYTGRNKHEHTDYYDEIIGQYDDSERKIVRSVLNLLFVRVPENPERPESYSRRLQERRERNRICHPDVFRYYTRMTVPVANLSSERVQDILSLLADGERFIEALRELIEKPSEGDRSNAYRFLNELSYSLDEVDTDDTEILLNTLFEIGDEMILLDPRRGMLDYGSEGHLKYIITEQLREKPRCERLSLLEGSIKQGDSPSLSLLIADRIVGEHENPKPNQQVTLSEEQLKHLKEIVVEEIDDLAKSRDLLDTPEFARIFINWRDWSTSSLPREWAEFVQEDPDRLAEVMQSICLSSGGKIVGVNPNSLDPPFDKEYIREKIETDDNYSEDKHVFSLYMSGMEAIDDGEDPDDPFYY